MNLKKFLAELKRRNVWKAAMAYIIASWIILQVMAVLLPAWDATEYIRLVFYLLIGAFPFWLIFSWIYEITPDGIKKTQNIDPENSISSKTGFRLNKIILGALGIAIVLLFINIFRNTPAAAVETQADTLALTDSIDSEKSIAVLAFADMSPKKDQEYFSDGISEEILNLLARIPELKVISRTSSFSFKGKDVTTREIAEALDVNHILEGSVRKSGNTLRITAQLINASNGAHLWSKTFDRDMADIFKIQDEIATEVTRELKATLMDEEIKSKEVDTEAYTIYLQARQLGNQFTAESNQSAIELLKKSVAIDSTYAPSWALLSRMYSRLGYNFLTIPKEEAYRKGVPAAMKSIELDPEYALAYAYLSIFQTSSFDFTNAADNIQKALELEPNNPEVLASSYVFNMVGLEEKVAALEKAISINPLDYHIYFNLGLMLFYEGHLEEAKENLKIYAQHYPDAAVRHYVNGGILIQEGKPDAAYEEMQKEEDPFFKKHGTILALIALGKQQEANSLFEEFIFEYPTEATNIAQIYAVMGKKDQAFDSLKKAIAINDPTITEGLYYPEFKSLRGDPRWVELINLLKLPEGHGVPVQGKT